MSAAKTGKYIELDAKANLVELLKTEKRVIVKFTATWCSPCETVMPKIKEFLGKYPKITVVSVDIDVHKELSKFYNVTHVPSFLPFYKAKMLDKLYSGSNLVTIEESFNTLHNWVSETSKPSSQVALPVTPKQSGKLLEAPKAPRKPRRMTNSKTS